MFTHTHTVYVHKHNTLDLQLQCCSTHTHTRAHVRVHKRVKDGGTFASRSLAAFARCSLATCSIHASICAPCKVDIVFVCQKSQAQCSICYRVAKTHRAPYL